MAFPEYEHWMSKALKEARCAGDAGEIPVGAVLVKDGAIVAAAGNRCEQDHDATAHAEMLVIREACQKLGTWRLSGCTLYVTLEPCPMCAGAIVNARIPQVIFGAKDPRAGAMGSMLNLPSYPLEGNPLCQSGVLEEECRAVLRESFSKIRKKQKM